MNIIFWLFFYILKGFFQKQKSGVQTPNLRNLFVQAKRQLFFSYAQTK